MAKTKTNNDIATTAIDEKLPVNETLIYGLQHAFVMISGAVAVPLIIAGPSGANLSSQEITFLISCTLLASGIATFLQSFGIKNFSGVKLPMIEATSFASVSFMQAVVSAYAKSGDSTMGLRIIAGSVFSAGLMCFLLSTFWGKLIKFFPKVVTGTVITILGISLLPVGISWSANLAPGQTAPYMKDIALAFSVLIIILLLTKFLKGIFASLAVLIGIAAGVLIAILTKQADFSQVSEVPMFQLIKPLYHGMPVFKIEYILPMLLIMLVIMTEATGGFMAVSSMAGREMKDKDLSKALRSSGISSMISSLLNSFPVSPFAQNIGLTSMTGVYSRFTAVAAGLIMIVLAFFPKFAAIFVNIPKPVLGGAGFFMFGNVAVSGIRTLGSVEFKENKNSTIVAVSIGLSLIPVAIPTFYDAFPEAIKNVFHSGLTLGCLSAIILNIFFNVLIKDNKSK